MTKKPQDRNEAQQGDALRRQIDELVSRMPRHAIRAVIDEIDATASGSNERAQTLRDALIGHFNKLRPFKARRLFTSLFEALLVDDPVLFRTREPIPGLVQRIDMGGIWHALSHLAFPTLAMDVQAKLDEMSQDAILDQVMVSPKAMVMRLAMSQQAADHFATLSRNRRLAEEFLAFANKEAGREARKRFEYLAVKAPIDMNQITFLQAVLEEGEALMPILDSMRADLSDTPASGEAREVEVDGQAAMLAGYMRQIRSVCAGRHPDDAVMWTPPLMALNVKRRYDVVLRYVREHAGPAITETHPLQQAVFGHFAASCGTMVEVIRGVFGEIDLSAGPILALPRPVRDTLDDALARFDRSLNVLSLSGMLSSKVVAPRVQPLLAAVTQELVQTMMPLASERAREALHARSGPAPDHDDVVWLLERVFLWGASLGAVGYANAELRGLKIKVAEDGRHAFAAALKIGGEDPADRMAQLVRINRLLNAIGENVGPLVSAASLGLQRLARHYLENPAEPGVEVRFVIDRFANAVRNELDRTRNWKSADLVELLRLYEARRHAAAGEA